MVTIQKAMEETGLSIWRMKQFCNSEGIDWIVKTVEVEKTTGKKNKPIVLNETVFTDDQYQKFLDRMIKRK